MCYNGTAVLIRFFKVKTKWESESSTWAELFVARACFIGQSLTVRATVERSCAVPASPLVAATTGQSAL